MHRSTPEFTAHVCEAHMTVIWFSVAAVSLVEIALAERDVLVWCNCRLEVVRCVDGVVCLVPGKCVPSPQIKFSRQHW